MYVRSQARKACFFNPKKEDTRMQKISYEIVKELNEKNATKNEINLLTYIAYYQDEFGRARGIHYKNAMEYMRCSVQGFYDALYGLEQKEIISVTHRKNDFDVLILNNNAPCTNNFKHGYIPLSCKVFKTEEYYKLPAKAKLLLMILVREDSILKKNTKQKSDSLIRNRENFLNRFSGKKGELKVSPKTIRQYLNTLKFALDLYFEDGKWFITFKKDMLYREYETDTLRQQQVDTAMRRNRIKNSSKTSGLKRKLQAFTNQIKQAANFDLSKIIYEAIKRKNPKNKNPYKWKRDLYLTEIEEIFAEVLLC